jgi:exodeoxyribonuclease V alpha subunit
MEQRVKIYGSIERVTYHNEENGFCVLRVTVKNNKEPVTVVGNATQVMMGEDIEATGVWIYDRNFGYQLKADNIKMTVPNSIEGIKKYLASGLIRGVGKHFAEILVNAFKEDVLNILDNEPEKVKGLPGIGPKRTERIVNSWHEQKAIREVMMFLHGHGVGTARAVRIYKTYGNDTIAKLQTNPYCLALDIWGIGFKTADQLAKSIGIEETSIIRAEAGIRHILNEHSTSGHCAILPEELIKTSVEMLAIPSNIIEQALINEIANANIIDSTIDEERHLYIAPLYYAEQGIVSSIKRLMFGNTSITISDAELLKLATKDSNIEYSTNQINAILMSIKNKVSIITGGPGVGKTTIVKGIIQVAKLLNSKITLCAPTGRAAKRLSETSGLEAKTIHRLLEYKPGQGPKYNAEYTLDTDFLIIDETSMVDVVLMNALLKAIPNHAQVLFVGDVDQLPSVGAGNVLGDMINSIIIPTSRLTEIFRQAQTSKIITNAHLINKGEMPYYNNKSGDDFFFINLDEPDDILNRILSIMADKLPKLYNLNSLTDIQVLVPMNKGTLGVKNLNVVIQDKLNPSTQNTITSMGINFRERDKIIQTVNNYDKEVFNGDIGFIKSINLDDDIVLIEYDGRLVEYAKSELDEIDLAYAISIHKSQGSEYPVVIMPVTTQHYTLLERNLLYTGITRGKKMVIMIGQKKALYLGVKKISSSKRITSLKQNIIKNVVAK